MLHIFFSAKHCSWNRVFYPNLACQSILWRQFSWLHAALTHVLLWGIGSESGRRCLGGFGSALGGARSSGERGFLNSFNRLVRWKSLLIWVDCIEARIVVSQRDLCLQKPTSLHPPSLSTSTNRFSLPQPSLLHAPLASVESPVLWRKSMVTGFYGAGVRCCVAQKHPLLHFLLFLNQEDVTIR